MRKWRWLLYFQTYRGRTEASLPSFSRIAPSFSNGVFVRGHTFRAYESSFIARLLSLSDHFSQATSRKGLQSTSSCLEPSHSTEYRELHRGFGRFHSTKYSVRFPWFSRYLQKRYFLVGSSCANFRSAQDLMSHSIYGHYGIGTDGQLGYWLLIDCEQVRFGTLIRNLRHSMNWLAVF